MADFYASLSDNAPTPGMEPALVALWWAAKGNWEGAHNIVQVESDASSAWVHAYLHRVEGDLGNARYWYRQAQRPVPTRPLAAEWDAIVQTLLAADAH